MPRPQAEPPPASPAVQAAAAVHVEDLERARIQWRRDAPAFFRYLLDAEVIE